MALSAPTQVQCPKKIKGQFEIFTKTIRWGLDNAVHCDIDNYDITVMYIVHQGLGHNCNKISGLEIRKISNQSNMKLLTVPDEILTDPTQL